MRIALLEDDVDQAKLVRSWLELAHHEVDHFVSGAALLNAATGKRYDLMIMDWMLPGLSGLEVLIRFRASGTPVPVLFLTQFDSPDNVATALEAGANDYLAKPVTRHLLVSRVQALLGPKAAEDAAREISCGRYHTDSASHAVRIDDRVVSLSETEFKLAKLMLAYPNRLVTRSDLRRAAHGMDHELDAIKDKLGLDGRKGLKLVKVHNLGYRLETA